MSVIGIDFGNESCFIAVARAGGIETIANDYSLRATPSCVAFAARNRVIGVAAANQRVTNVKNTIVGFKRLLGRKFNDPYVSKELQQLPFTAVPTEDGSIGIKVFYMGEEHIFTPEQITAMQFTKLKEIAEVGLKIKVHDCVISVPSYFTQAERRALLDAAQVAGLNVLRLLNETTSTALAYGIYKQDLPAPEEKPRNVVFVDCGHSSLQVSVAAFNKAKLVMLASASDANLGGRDFDRILAEHLCHEFQNKYKLDVMRNPRAHLRLLGEVDKLKKQMSANSTKLPLYIECFMEDKDVESFLQRADMETKCSNLFARVENTLRQCLQDCKLSLDDIHSVEVVGGSTRIPAIKMLIEKVFHKQASTTLNQDEAVARGCALQCATLSPNFRVRDFSVRDIQPYPIQLQWDNGNGQMELFEANHPVPYSKVLTFYKQSPFVLEAFYSGKTPHPDPCLGKFFINDVKPGPDGKDSAVKVKLRINLHGILVVSFANLLEPLPPAAEPVEQPQENGTKDEQSAKTGDGEKMDTESQAAGESATEGAETSNKDEQEEEVETTKSSGTGGGGAKRRMRTVSLNVNTLSHGVDASKLNELIEAESRMIAADSQEKNRIDMKNSLEEYSYDLRGNLLNPSTLGPYVPPDQVDKLAQQLDDIVNWLYEDGADCERSLYAEKLDELKKLGEPIKTRKIEADVRPRVIEELLHLIQLSRKVQDEARGNKVPVLDQQAPPAENRFVEISPDDLSRAQEETNRIEKWIHERQSMLVAKPLYLDPPVTVAEIRSEKQNFENIVSPIYNKMKRKEDRPPPSEGTQPTKEQAQTGNEKMDID